MFETTLNRRSFLKGAAALGLKGALAPMAALADETADAAGDASVETPETVTVKSLDGNKEQIDVEVPFDPQRIVILDMASLDILNSLGVAEGRIVGSASTSLEYLAPLVEAEGVVNCGTIKEADLEAVMECAPDVIFIGGRLAASYDALTEIAPTVYIATDTELGVVESVRTNAANIATMFGLEAEVDELMAAFDERIAALQEFAAGKTCIVGLVTSGSCNLLGNDGRCSIVGNEIGFENVASEEVTATHGNESSFETIVSLDPDYIFILDRDTAIATEGAQLAAEVMDNELVNGTRAVQDGHMVIFEHPAVWYTAEGGIEALDVMLADLEGPLLGATAGGDAASAEEEPTAEDEGEPAGEDAAAEK